MILAAGTRVTIRGSWGVTEWVVTRQDANGRVYLQSVLRGRRKLKDREIPLGMLDWMVGKKILEVVKG